MMRSLLGKNLSFQSGLSAKPLVQILVSCPPHAPNSRTCSHNRFAWIFMLLLNFRTMPLISLHACRLPLFTNVD